MPPVGSLGIDGTGAAFGRRLQFGPNACRAPEGCAPRPGCVGRTAECPKSPSVPGWAGWAGWPGWQRAVTSGHPEREAVSAAIRRVEADAASRDAGRIEARRIRRTGPRVCCQGPACEAVVDVRPRAATPRCDPCIPPSRCRKTGSGRPRFAVATIRRRRNAPILPILRWPICRLANADYLSGGEGAIPASCRALHRESRGSFDPERRTGVHTTRRVSRKRWVFAWSGRLTPPRPCVASRVSRGLAARTDAPGTGAVLSAWFSRAMCLDAVRENRFGCADEARMRLG